jgi:23S rRNA (uracil1939-C5)-methyltransferase
MQSNHKQAEILYSEAIRLAGFNGDEICIDAYCGTGSTTLSFADYVGKITGVEVNESAYKDAVKNMSANKIRNAGFVLADATLYMEELAGTGERIDCVILDPTRAGTTRQFIRACGRLKPSKILYISCCPETLARDLKGFRTQGYEACIAKPVDMFPWTDKIETIVVLKRIK